MHSEYSKIVLQNLGRLKVARDKAVKEAQQGVSTPPGLRKYELELNTLKNLLDG